MLCKNPFLQGLLAFGCGQCLPCRMNRRRLWTHRMMLETYVHPHSSFVTLTYAPENIPEGGTLDPQHYRDWLKKLRHLTKVRYYLVGEYGDESQRPHYHAALFGYPPCVHGRPITHKQCTCSTCEPIARTWGLGLTYNAELTWESAQYVSQYVTKKMTKKDDPRLHGRHPEFARQSLKPGLGALSLDKIIDVIESTYGAEELDETGDVPSILQHGKKKFPLGRYLRSKLREKYGFAEKTTPKEVLQILKTEMQQLFKDHVIPTENTPWDKAVRKNFLIQQNAQKVLNMETKFKIKNGGSL